MRRAVATVVCAGVLVAVALTRGSPLQSGNDDAFRVVFSTAFVVARVLGSYLLLVVALDVVARVVDAAPLRRLSAVLTPALVQRALAIVFAAGTSCAAALPVRAADSTVVVVQLATGEERAPTGVAQSGTRAPSVSAPVVPDRTWTVRPGDHFWSIATTLAGDGDVTAMWARLVDLNRDRLVDRSNPDLLLPGQQLRLPSRRQM